VPLAGRLVGVTLLAAAAAAAPARAVTITRGPFIQNPDGATSTMTVEWWTDTAGDGSVEYGPTPALGFTATVPQTGSCEVGSAGTCHVVPLGGLLPGTRYYYRLRTNGTVVQDTGPSGPYFTTLRTPLDPSDLFFTVVGDWGGATSQEQNVASLQDAADPQITVSVGDNAYEFGTQSEWDSNALPYYQNNFRRIPFFPALGNHDLYSVGNPNWASSAEIKMFLLPRNGTQPERFYSFDHGDAHFTVLDSNSCCDATQLSWLANDLATTTRKWKFAFFHHTPYSCASGFFSNGSNLAVRTSWGPLFEQYGVDIVFDGHDHLYERSGYVDDFHVDGSGGGDGLGTYYVMTGGGGKSVDSPAELTNGVPKQPLASQ